MPGLGKPIKNPIKCRGGCGGGPPREGAPVKPGGAPGSAWSQGPPARHCHLPLRPAATAPWPVLSQVITVGSLLDRFWRGWALARVCDAPQPPSPTGLRPSCPVPTSPRRLSDQRQRQSPGRACFHICKVGARVSAPQDLEGWERTGLLRPWSPPSSSLPPLPFPGFRQTQPASPGATSLPPLLSPAGTRWPPKPTQMPTAPAPHLALFQLPSGLEL